MSKAYIGVSKDHSISMRGIREAAARDYNETVSVITEQSNAAGQDTVVSVVRCGSGPRAEVIRESTIVPLTSLKQIRPGEYITDGGSTPLFDSVGDLIEQFEGVPDAATASFLVMAITDGEENSSRRWSPSRLMQKINELQKTDRWTFVFRVPRGTARNLSRQFGIPEGNILEWDQTDRGFAVSTQATREAFTQYYTDLKAGVKSTKRFYSNLAEVDVKTIKAALVDVSGLVDLWITSQQEVIKPFCEKKSKAPFIKGAAFYQLTKTEREVQDYKQIVIRDKTTGSVYGGGAARDLLGLPKFGTVPLIPGDHGQYDIYVQSTSINRVLPAGTQLLYWPTWMTPPAVNTPSPQAAKKVAAVVATQAAAVQIAPAVKAVQVKTVPGKTVQAVTNALTTPVAKSALGPNEFARGYSAGFDQGKVKSMATTASAIQPQQYRDGYVAGYKDGRGKKKRLYK